jgi:hypothetical protein
VVVQKIAEKHQRTTEVWEIAKDDVSEQKDQGLRCMFPVDAGLGSNNW